MGFQNNDILQGFLHIDIRSNFLMNDLDFGKKAHSVDEFKSAASFVIGSEEPVDMRHYFSHEGGWWWRG